MLGLEYPKKMRLFRNAAAAAVVISLTLLTAAGMVETIVYEWI